MYGLVNRAIEELIASQYDAQTWEAIKRRVGLELDSFLSMEAYPNHLTDELVAASAAETGMTQAQLLEAFGEYGVLYTAQHGYGELLSVVGRSLPDFLHQLNELHGRVALNFPHLTPPTFTCRALAPNVLRLRYCSARLGLAPMVIGLLRGLGRLFHLDLRIEHSTRKSETTPHDESTIYV